MHREGVKRNGKEYRCKECIKGQQKIFITAKPQDYLIGFVGAFIGMAVGQLIGNAFGFFILFIAPLVGGFIGDILLRLVGKRRSPNLNRIILVGGILGGLVPNFPTILVMLMGGGFALAYGILWPAIFLALAVPSMLARFSGIRLRR